MKKLLAIMGLVLLLASTAFAGNEAVIVVDVQTCFLEEGTLPVAGADKYYIQQVNSDTKYLAKKGCIIFATKDYHPQGHISFASTHDLPPFTVIELPYGPQVLWPDHCSQGADGGESPQIRIDNNLFFEVVKKGQDPNADSYSGFEDADGAETEMHNILQRNGVTDLVVYGLALDYSVYFTAKDAIERGYNVTLVLDLCRFIALETANVALADMEAIGVNIVNSMKDIK